MNEFQNQLRQLFFGDLLNLEPEYKDLVDSVLSDLVSPIQLQPLKASPELVHLFKDYLPKQILSMAQKLSPEQQKLVDDLKQLGMNHVAFRMKRYYEMQTASDFKKSGFHYIVSMEQIAEQYDIPEDDKLKCSPEELKTLSICFMN